MTDLDGVSLATLDRYLAIKDQIALLQVELELLSPHIIEHVQLQGGRLLYGDREVCVRQRVTYDYSSAVLELRQKLKERQRDEERSGVAVVKVATEFLYVRAR